MGSETTKEAPDVNWNPVNNGIFTMSTDAGCLPSTIVEKKNMEISLLVFRGQLYDTNPNFTHYLWEGTHSKLPNDNRFALFEPLQILKWNIQHRLTTTRYDVMWFGIAGMTILNGSCSSYCWWCWNPKQPVEVGSLSHYFQGLTTIPGRWPWDFWSIYSIIYH